MLRSLITVSVILVFSVASANASAVFTDEAAFRGSVSSYYLETFTGCEVPSDSYSNGIFSYTVAASGGGLYCGNWVGNSGNQLYGVTSPETELLFTFTGASTRAVGGYFFVTDIRNNLLNGTVTLTFSDGMVQTLNSSTSGALFLGYVSDVPLTSLRIAGSSAQTSYVTLDDFYAGTVPEPSTWLLLASGGLLALVRLRKK